MIPEKDCPKCKAEGAFHKLGLWTNEVWLNLSEDNSPAFLNDRLQKQFKEIKK